MKNIPKTTFCSDRVPNIGYLDFRNKFKLIKYQDALNRDIMVSRDVTQSAILPGTRWAGTKREKIEVREIMKEGKKVWLM